MSRYRYPEVDPERIPGRNPLAKALWIVDAALEEVEEDEADVAMHLEHVEQLLLQHREQMLEIVKTSPALRTTEHWSTRLIESVNQDPAAGSRGAREVGS